VKRLRRIDSALSQDPANGHKTPQEIIPQLYAHPGRDKQTLAGLLRAGNNALSIELSQCGRLRKRAKFKLLDLPASKLALTQTKFAIAQLSFPKNFCAALRRASKSILHAMKKVNSCHYNFPFQIVL
jgi:hypothetical protein